MTTPDLIDRMREANPVAERDLEPTRPDALERLLERAADEERAPAPRRGFALPRMAFGVAAGLAVAVVALVVGLGQLGGGAGVDPVAEARAALGARGGVFHIETVYRSQTGRSRGAAVRTETWVAGRRGRSIQYGPDGPAAESVSTPGRTPETQIYGRLTPGAGVRSDDPATTNPRQEILRLLRSGRVRDEGVTEAGGRRERTLVVRTRRGPSRNEDSRSGTAIEVPAHTATTVIRLDERSKLPVSVRRTSLGGSFDGGTASIERFVDTERYLTFERLTGREGAEKLRPSRRFRGR